MQYDTELGIKILITILEATRIGGVDLAWLVVVLFCPPFHEYICKCTDVF